MKNISIGLAIGSIGTVVLSGLIGTILVLSNVILISFNLDTRLTRETENKVLQEVSTIYLFDMDQQISVTKITDVENLQNQQAFYEKAQNGDYLIILSDDKKALIYRDTSKKLINAGPVVTE